MPMCWWWKKFFSFRPVSVSQEWSPNPDITLPFPLTVGEVVQCLPEILHPCVRWLEVLKPGWWGQNQMELILRSLSPTLGLRCPAPHSLSLRRASTVTSGSPHTFFSNSCHVSKSSTACGTTFSRPACMADTCGGGKGPGWGRGHNSQLSVWWGPLASTHGDTVSLYTLSYNNVFTGVGERNSRKQC